MESDGEDLENMFEEYDNTENDREAENNQANSESSGVKVPVPKRIVKNPRLKFNAERLIGERGIPVLVEHFKNVKFKGIGHEKEDLDKILTKLEHWTHRLFPSMKFEDCLHHIEKLGKKRPVQTCLHKMRLNMPILSSDFVKDDDDNVQRVEDSVEEVDAFDSLIAESQDIVNPNISSVEGTFDTNFMASPTVQTTHGKGQVLGSSSGSSLTEEQRERIERNRMLAAERRKAKLAALQQNSSEISPMNEKIIPSENIFNTQDKSSIRNQENVEEDFSKVNNQDVENLGLDDLVNLVSGEETFPDKNAPVCSNKEEETVCSNSKGDDDNTFNSLYFEEKTDVDISDTTNSKMIISEEKFRTENEENLGIESLLDLVNDNSDPICSKNSISMSEIEKDSVLLDADEPTPMI